MRDRDPALWIKEVKKPRISGCGKIGVSSNTFLAAGISPFHSRFGSQDLGGKTQPSEGP